MASVVVCPHCGLEYETGEMVSANGFYGCVECFNEHAARRGASGKQVRRRPERSSGPFVVDRRKGFDAD